MNSRLKFFYKILAFSAMLALIINLAVNGQSPATKQMTSEFDKLLSAQFKPGEPGCAALVAVKGQIIYKKAFGMADLELNVPLQADYIFRIGSITKQFTAIAILQLMEQGKLSLQDDITKFIPDYPTQAYKITIENLLTHTSGIKSFTNVPEYQKYIREDLKPAEVVDKFKNLPMEFAPGSRWNYNNSGFFLLGCIIEKVSGKTYQEYLSENILKPAGMLNTLYGDDSKIVKNRALGYKNDGDAFANADYLSMLLPFSAGALMSTVEDLYKWNRALISQKLVKKETLDKAFTEYKLSNGEGTGYGYGWFLRKLQNSPSIEHGGAINGFLSNEIYLPQEDVFVAVFSNCTSKSPELVSNKMAAIAIGKALNYTEIQVDEAILGQYAGVYEDKDGNLRYIIKEGSQLFSQRSGAQKNRIKAFAADRFFFNDSFTTLSFIRNSSGTVESASIDDRGLIYIWKKTDKAIPAHSEIRLPAEVLNRYTGDFELAPGFIISVTVDEDRIFTQATGQGKFEIFAESETRFFLKVVEATLDFVKDDSGKYNKVILHQGGQIIEGYRK